MVVRRQRVLYCGWQQVQLLTRVAFGLRNKFLTQMNLADAHSSERPVNSRSKFSRVYLSGSSMLCSKVKFISIDLSEPGSLANGAADLTASNAASSCFLSPEDCVVFRFARFPFLDILNCTITLALT